MNKELQDLINAELVRRKKVNERLIKKGVYTEEQATFKECGFVECANFLEEFFENKQVDNELPTEDNAVKLYLLMSLRTCQGFDTNGAFIKSIKRYYKFAKENWNNQI